MKKKIIVSHSIFSVVVSYEQKSDLKPGNLEQNACAVEDEGQLFKWNKSVAWKRRHSVFYTLFHPFESLILIVLMSFCVQALLRIHYCASSRESLMTSFNNFAVYFTTV